MPSGDNWQSDVLRDLRSSGTPRKEPEGPQEGAHAPSTPGQGSRPDAAPRPDAAAQPGAEATGVPAQSQGQVPGQAQWAAGPQGQAQPHAQGAAPAYGYPHQPQPAPSAHPRQPHGAEHQPHAAQPQPYAAHQPYPAGTAPQQPYPPQGPAQEAYASAAQQPQPHPAAVPPQAHAQAAHAYPQTASGAGAARSASGSAAHRATPDSRPVVDKRLAAAGAKPRHGEPFAARALRAVRRTVSSSAAREVAETTATAEVLQQPVTTGRQIAVTSIRGGSGKTTVSALLATTYAHYRQDPVLVVEADPALGSLPLRLGAETLRWTTGDLAGIVEPQMSLLDVTGYLVQLPDNAWLLPGSQGQVGAMLDTKGYERVMVSLRRFFGVTVVDCETLPAEVARTALSAAQARVLTVPATLEGIASTHAVLEWMRALPRDITTSTVVVLTETVPHPGLDLDKAAEQLKATGASVRVLPYDRHLAAGGTIRTELLAQATRQAVTRLAAEVFQLSHKRR
ncbi:MinD/ParA family ATP-binding protein [Streptomyces mexicanus]|uniref:MinD/ParA family ATP-binding protein n=1 Tax=Streptomyces mexicanus TaxID=178566 RepID=UPI003647D182